jgi:hypothetical protein
MRMVVVAAIDVLIKNKDVNELLTLGHLDSFQLTLARVVKHVHNVLLEVQSAWCLCPQGRAYIYSTALPTPVVAAAQAALAVSYRQVLAAGWLIVSAMVDHSFRNGRLRFSSCLCARPDSKGRLSQSHRCCLHRLPLSQWFDPVQAACGLL